MNFDEALLPEDSWLSDLAEDEFEVERITDMRSGRRTRTGRVHGQFKVYGNDMVIRSGWMKPNVTGER